MPIVKMPDGSLVEMPDQLSPEQAFQLRALQGKQAGMEHKQGPDPVDVGKFAKDSVKHALLRGPALALSAFSGVGPLAGAVEGTDPIKGQESGETALNAAVPPEPGAWFRAMEGGGGGFVMGPSGGLRNVVTNVASGVASSLASEGASAALEGQNPTLRKIGTLLAGVGTGAATGFGLGPKQTPAEKTLRNAAQGSDFPSAQKNADTFNQAGSTTATAAEAFPENNKLLALALEARNSPGGDALRNRTAGRAQDLGRMTDEFLNRIGPEVSPNAVANDVADAANANLQNLQKLKSDSLGNRLAGKVVPDAQVADIYRQLQTRAKNEPSPEVADAYRAVAEQLIHQDGNNFITDLQQLSFQLKRLKENPPTQNASTGRKINSSDLSVAVRDAEEALGSVAPDFKEGMEDYAKFSQEVHNPAKEGPIGKLADRNPNLVTPTPASRLEAIIKDQNPKAISGTMQELGDSSLFGNRAANRKDIVRALMQRKLEAGSTNPGQQVRGQVGSQLDKNLDALLNGAGVDPIHAKQPLEAADLLQNIQGPPSLEGSKPNSVLDSVVRPMRALGMLASGQTQEKYYQQIAEILAKPNRQSIEKLQEIAMFDPKVRKMLTAKGAIIPLLMQQEGEK